MNAKLPKVAEKRVYGTDIKDKIAYSGKAKRKKASHQSLQYQWQREYSPGLMPVVSRTPRIGTGGACAG